MTIFSAIWFITVLWCFTRQNLKYMLFITLLFMTFQCDDVIVIGNTGIGPQILTSAIFVIKVLFNNKGIIYLQRKHTTVLVAMSLPLAAVVVSLVYNNIFNEKILNLGQLFIYILCFTFILLSGSTVDKETLYQILRKIIIFLLVIGIIQLFTTMEILPLRSVMKVLFYNDNSTTVYFNHSNYRRIMSTFMEPSYFAGLLVGAFYYFLSLRDRWKENYFLMAAIFVEIVLTMSSTAFAAFVIVGVLFIVLQDRINLWTKIIVVAVAVICIGVLYFGFYDVLDAVIFSKSESGSYMTRTNMNRAAYRSYLESVWFGIGYKTVRGSSIFYSLLAETGRLGLGAYLIMNIAILSPIITASLSRRKYSNYHIAILFAVLSIFVCQLIACPDLDLSTYWFWLYVYSANLMESVHSNERFLVSEVAH